MVIFPSCSIVLMKVIGLRTEEGEGEGTNIVAFVNALIDVFKEVLDSLHKLGRSVCVSVHSIVAAEANRAMGSDE